MPKVTTFRANPRGEMVEVYRGIPIVWDGRYYTPDVVGPDGGNVVLPRASTVLAARRLVGFALKRGAKKRPARNPSTSRKYVDGQTVYVRHPDRAERIPSVIVDASQQFYKHILKVREPDGYTGWVALVDVAATAKRRSTKNPTRRTRTNPPALPVSYVLSDRAYDLSYKHAEDGKDYRHKFASGVRVQLLADGSVRMYRPDGRPIWRNFR